MTAEHQSDSDSADADLQWRGFSLDIARSFFPLPILLGLVDQLADLGLNVFHLHLSDDQGWRIEIPGRPELTARSGGTAVAGGDAGWLTVRDWETLVTHAQRRGVMIVPEVDVPGHTNAALHACPELNPSGQAASAYDGVKVGFSGLDASLEATEQFMRDVYGALALMTPTEWIHIGGDECHSMSEPDYIRLVTMAVSIVEQSGKKPVAWQEASIAGLGERLTLQFWMSLDDEEKWLALPAESLMDLPVARSAIRSRQALLREAKRGARVIMSPARHAYFDLKYDHSDQRGQDWAGVISVEKARAWHPLEVLADLDPSHVLGAEAAVWTEFIHTSADLHHMIDSRLDSFAQVMRRAR